MNRTELERVSPGAVGISAGAIEAFLDELESGFTEMHGLMILRHGKVCAEGWWSPYAPGIRHGLQSLSKTYAATAVGIACMEGILRLDERVAELFTDEMPAEPSAWLRQMTVRDVLCMGTGQEAMPRPSMNWIQDFLATPVLHEPGSAFFYNSTGSTLLAAMVTRRAGVSLQEYLKTRLFDPIGIDADNLRWGTMPDGVEVGGGGLFATTEDNLRLMKLYLDGGVWQGKRILSEEYVRLATTKQIDTAAEALVNPPALDNFVGYGFQIWMCRHPGCYRADGAFGQYSIVNPKLDLIVSINETAANAHWAQKTLDCVWRFFERLEREGDAQDAPAEARLFTRLKQLSLPHPVFAPYGKGETMEGTYAVREGELVFGEATAGMMGGQPLPPAVKQISLRFTAADCRLTLLLADQTELDYVVATDGSRRENDCGSAFAPLTRVLLSGYWQAQETFVVRARWIETCFEQAYAFTLEQGTLRVKRSAVNGSFPFFAALVPGECAAMRVNG
ncbi:MAG TPA: serine hydrolase [Feifaniaceae bacterium]|nr:serine hydrolase [Feifaniaceae bacterium]